MPDNAEPFARMAESIRHNADKPFGGAVVWVPPDGKGEPVEMLLLNSPQDVAQFFGMIKATAELKLAEEAVREQRQNMGYGGLR